MHHCSVHKTQVSNPQSKLKLLKERLQICGHESQEGYSIYEPKLKTPMKKPSKFDQIPTPKYTAVKFKLRAESQPADVVSKVLSYLDNSPCHKQLYEQAQAPARFKKQDIKVEVSKEHKMQI